MENHIVTYEGEEYKVSIVKHYRNVYTAECDIKYNGITMKVSQKGANELHALDKLKKFLEK